MINIKVKPMSVNKAWRGGRRFKSNDYLVYEQELTYLLPKNMAIPKTQFGLRITFWVSNSNCDIDNFLKPLIDVMSKKYKFNDNMIYELQVRKVKVKKGGERIGIEIIKLK